MIYEIAAPLAKSPRGNGQRGCDFGLRPSLRKKAPPAESPRGNGQRAEVLKIALSNNFNKKVLYQDSDRLVDSYNFLTALELEMTYLKRFSVEKSNRFLSYLEKFWLFSAKDILS